MRSKILFAAAVIVVLGLVFIWRVSIWSDQLNNSVHLQHYCKELGRMRVAGEAYPAEFVRVDAYGGRVLYSLSKEGPTLVSFGSDHAPDHDYSSGEYPEPGTRTCADTSLDTVFRNCEGTATCFK